MATAKKAKGKKVAKRAVKKAPAKKAAKKPAAKAMKKAPAARKMVERAAPETLRLRAVMPSLTVSDLAKSEAFYVGGLGFIICDRWMHEGKLVGLMLKAGACDFAIAQDDWAKGRDRVRGTAMRIWCETAQDIDALAQRAKRAGGKITVPPKDHAWGARAFDVDDPDGFHLTFFKQNPKPA